MWEIYDLLMGHSSEMCKMELVLINKIIKETELNWTEPNWTGNRKYWTKLNWLKTMGSIMRNWSTKIRGMGSKMWVDPGQWAESGKSTQGKGCKKWTITRGVAMGRRWYFDLRLWAV